MAALTLQCIICLKALTPLSEGAPTQPLDSLCFTGTGHYGSGRDNEHQTIGLDHFEIFICDNCWEAKRKLSIGVKLEDPKYRKRFFFSGVQVEAAFTRSRERKTRISVSDMFDPVSDGD